MRVGLLWMAVVACDTAPVAPCGDALRGGPPTAAYVGFRWACDHANPCAAEIDCDDPGWQALDAARLAWATACVLGPCERRRECLEEVVATCAAQ